MRRYESEPWLVDQYQQLLRRVPHSWTAPVVGTEKLDRETVEDLVATDGNLQATMHAADLRLQVEQPCSTVAAHQENIVKSENKTAALGALRHRTSMRHNPNLHGNGGQGPLARPERFQGPITLWRAPSPEPDFTTALSLVTARRGRT